MANYGILITNVGTPDAPTPKAVKDYLNTFLSDPRVVEFPAFLWQPILKTIILPIRSKYSAKLYQAIWTDNGSPLLYYSKQLTQKLEEALQLPVALGMHYSSPSVESAIQSLLDRHCDHIILLPLFPHSSGTTTGSSVDRLADYFKNLRTLPSFSAHLRYGDNPHYIHAIASSIQDAWKVKEKSQHLLFSFHSIPKRYADLGDAYPKECYSSAKLIADSLKLKREEWSVAFQSRLGRTEWLKPYTDETLRKFPNKGIYSLDVICPGFSVDCLETLEEINIRGKEQFLNAGGQSFNYIPALNDSDHHIQLLHTILKKYLHE